MGWLDNVLDWAADKVQTVTGEKERRENVAKVKETYETYRWQVETNIDSVNSSITEQIGRASCRERVSSPV